MPAAPQGFFRSVLRGVLFSILLTAAGLPLAHAGGGGQELYEVGLRTFGVWEPKTETRLDFAVWYPSRLPAQENVLEGWLVAAGKRGRIVPGFFPVVLVSHDTAGGRFAHNDMAASLAAAGMVVIAPTHTGDSQISGEAVYTAELLRDRPRHLLRALETVLAHPDFAAHVDESRIGLLGVGFGAITALQLAGAAPDFTPLAGYCRDDGPQDAFCSPWTAQRLSRLAESMYALEEWQGGGLYTPALDLYAPRLVRVTVPPELLAAADAADVTRQKRGLWQRLFGSEEEEESPPAAAPPAAPAEPLPQGAAPSTDNFPLLLDFQGGPRFGGTDSGSPFVHIALADSQQYRVPVSDDRAGGMASPETARQQRDDGSGVYLRPAEARRIRAVVLAAPAGGMLFSKEALARVRVPVAVVEAGQDNLYPPDRHSQPYMINLPSLPLVLHLENSDHFSLFAPCSRETLRTLGDICGRVDGDARHDLAKKRDRFITPFFQSVLGGPLPAARPSGFVAGQADP